MKITLCPYDQELCRQHAKCRSANNRDKGVSNQKQGTFTDEKTDLQGFGAEFAFCKLYNCFPDFSIGARSARLGTDNFDALVSGFFVDVKSVADPNGKLTVAHWKANGPAPDYYALMVGTFPDFEFKGFMSATELLRRRRLQLSRNGNWVYIAEQGELTMDLPRDARLSLVVEQLRPSPSVERKRRDGQI